MISRMYSLYDKKTQVFDKPIFAPNDETIIRSVKNAFTDERSKDIPFITNPEDFQVFLIGTYNDNTGTIESKVLHIIDILEIQPENNIVELKQNAKE